MRAVFRKRLRRWIDRRIPRSDEQVLTQRNLFILPTGAGVMFGVVLLVMLVTGINYQNSLIYLLTFLLGAVFVSAMHQTHRNLSGIVLTLVHSGEGFAGDAIDFRFRLVSTRGDAVAVKLAGPGDGPEPLYLPENEPVDVSVPVAARQRGHLILDQLRIDTVFPFGLLRAWSWMQPASAGLAFPRPLQPKDDGGSLVEGDQPIQNVPAMGQDHAEIRPWRQGDMSQRVLWKRYARTGEMLISDWQGEQGSPQWLDYDAFPGVDRELRLSYLAFLVLGRERQSHAYGLRLPGQSLQPDQGPGHLRQCLRALAVFGLTEPAAAAGPVPGNALARRRTDRPESGRVSL